MKIYGSLINHKKNIHMIGIGGVSMSAIAVMLKEDGHNVTGTDDNYSLNVQKLMDAGIDVNIGPNLKNVQDADLIIYTNAISENYPEMECARNMNKDIIERSDFMNILTKTFDECIGVSGTHGKTTTTSMISLCFLEGKKDPSIQVGAYLKNIDSNFRVGKSEYLIIESCEYRDSFLKFNPDTVVVLNVDLDHTDYFENLEDIKESFKKFIEKVPKTGKIIVNGDDENIKDITTKNEFLGKIVTVGKDESSDYHYDNIEYFFERENKDEDGYNSSREYVLFDFFKGNEKIGKIKLYALGIHNIFNACISAATAMEYGISFEDAKNGLLKFEGASRRFDYKGKVNGARIFDDYAHHPREIESLGNAVSKLDKNHAYGVFEIHTMTRANMFLNDFGKALNAFDTIIVAPIYRARKEDAKDISGEEIRDKIKEYDNSKTVIYIDNYPDIKKYLLENLEKGDVVFTIGAGKVTDLAEDLVRKD